MVRKISEKEFDDAKNSPVALIDFSATWCGPCKMIAPVVEEVSDEMKDEVSFFNVDVDENPSLAAQFGVQSIPTLVVLKNGKVMGTQVGFIPKENIIGFIKSHI